MTDSVLPTAKLRVIDPANAVDEIFAFAKGLEAEGKRPWFEVRYPAPDHLSQEEKDRWTEQQESVFDAVEVKDGEVITLPPYSELEKEAN